jgi:hypothetical protein
MLLKPHKKAGHVSAMILHMSPLYMYLRHFIKVYFMITVTNCSCSFFLYFVRAELIHFGSGFGCVLCIWCWIFLYNRCCGSYCLPPPIIGLANAFRCTFALILSPMGRRRGMSRGCNDFVCVFWYLGYKRLSWSIFQRVQNRISLYFLWLWVHGASDHWIMKSVFSLMAYPFSQATNKEDMKF